MADATIDSVDLTAAPSMQTKMPCSDGTGVRATISVEQILALAPDPEPGADGVGVSAVTINGSGNLIITLTDTSVHDLGRVVGIDGDDGISITGVAINGSNHLIVTLSTGSTIDAGALPSGGGTGDMLKSTYDPDGDGHISYNDLEDKPTLGTAAAADAANFADATTTAEALLAMAEEIEALGTPSGGMTNPMTAAGDIIIGGTDGAPTRLPKGADGQVLTLAAGAPAWGDAPSGGTSSPLIAEYIVGSGTSSGTTHYVGDGSAVSSINISDLDGNSDGGYWLEISAVNSTASYATIAIAVNGSSSPRIGYVTSTGYANITSGLNVYLPPASGSYSDVLLHTAANRTYATVFSGESGWYGNTLNFMRAEYDSQSNITSITLTSSVANTICVGSKITLRRK